MSSAKLQSLKREHKQHASHLDNACSQLGVSAEMFRTAKFLFYMSTLAFTAYLIEIASVEPLLAMAFAALLVAGPEGVEAYLVRQDILPDE